MSAASLSAVPFYTISGQREGSSVYIAGGKRLTKIKDTNNCTYLRCKFQKRTGCQGRGRISEGLYYETREHTCAFLDEATVQPEESKVQDPAGFHLLADASFSF